MFYLLGVGHVTNRESLGLSRNGRGLTPNWGTKVNVFTYLVRLRS